MKHIIFIAVAFLCATQAVAANVYITEVMHSPTQMAHSDGEWIELYNNGVDIIDLSNWTLDGNDFDDTLIQPGEYIVVARELVDGTDTDLDSFESYWGLDNITAVDGTFSLTADDTITLTNGIYIEDISYNSSFGGVNGRTIERVSLTEWKDGEIDGTPGFGVFSSSNVTNEVILFLTVIDSGFGVNWMNITVDDSNSPGVQLMPNVKEKKIVTIEVSVNGTEELGLLVNNKTYNLTLVNDTYVGNFTMEYFDLAGLYNVSLLVGGNVSNHSVSFEYLGMIFTELNTTSLEFNASIGGEDTQTIQVINFGNVVVDTELSADDFASSDSMISVDNLDVFDGIWYPLVGSVLVDKNILPLSTGEVQLRVRVPSDASVGNYKGRVVVNSMESV